MPFLKSVCAKFHIVNDRYEISSNWLSSYAGHGSTLTRLCSVPGILCAVLLIKRRGEDALLKLVT